MSEESELAELPTNNPSPQVQPTSLDSDKPIKAQKRRREESTITVNKHSSLYFPNGDIVLLSLPDTNSVITAFRVDRVYLLRSSPVFEGMVQLPPSQDVEMFDSVPLVRLQDESEHLEKFLNALYDSRCIPWRKHDPDRFHIVEGILLLATKYQVDHLRERIISLLELDWPPTLRGWDINQDEITIMSQMDDNVDFNSLTSEPCAVIRLARKCGVDSILPAAFYHLSRISGIADRRLIASAQTWATTNITNGQWSAEFSLLSIEDFRRLIVGRDALSIVFKNCYEEATEAIRCKSSKSECVRVFQTFGARLDTEMLRDRDPLDLMKDGVPGQACQSCLGALRRNLGDKRKALWERLPTLFLLNSTS